MRLLEPIFFWETPKCRQAALRCPMQKVWQRSPAPKQQRAAGPWTQNRPRCHDPRSSSKWLRRLIRKTMDSGDLGIVQFQDLQTLTLNQWHHQWKTEVYWKNTYAVSVLFTNTSTKVSGVLATGLPGASTFVDAAAWQSPVRCGTFVLDLSS